MCGILLIINKKNKNLDRQKCISSLEKISHRGPDYKLQHFPKNHIFFGQVVLSLTGMIKKNYKYFYSKAKKYHIIFNGEIYNYKSINEKFKLLNQTKNTTDTEVLVNFFENFSVEFVNKNLDGMYAYILHDLKNNKIFFSRDPQGEKILYYYSDENHLIISSEIIAITNYIEKIKLDKNILKTYFFSRHFISFDRTIYKKIKILEPGHTKSIDLKNYKIKNYQTFDIFNYIQPSKYNYFQTLNEEEIVSELDNLMKYNLHEMIPDRNYISIVSGGIDSTLISKYLTLFKKPKSLIFLNHKGKDPISNKINLFNNYFDRIDKIMVDKKIYFKNYLKALDICKSPIFSHDFVGKLMLAEITKTKNTKCIFGGDGADELFGGYSTYNQKIKNLMNNYSNYSRILFPRSFKKDSAYSYFKKKLDYKWDKCLKAYYFIKNKMERNKAAMMLMDLSVQLSCVGLRGADLMGMSCGVEMRSPFLRKQILEFGLSLPLKYKLDDENSIFSNKKVLKKLFLKYFSKKHILPKQGFAGFPNETYQFLESKDKFIVFDFLSIDKKLAINDMKNREFAWKIYNTEFFLRKFFN